MKKFISIAMALSLAASLLMGCSTAEEVVDDVADDVTNGATDNATNGAIDGDMNTPANESNGATGTVDPSMGVGDATPNDGVMGDTDLPTDTVVDPGMAGGTTPNAANGTTAVTE